MAEKCPRRAKGGQKWQKKKSSLKGGVGQCLFGHFRPLFPKFAKISQKKPKQSKVAKINQNQPKAANLD